MIPLKWLSRGMQIFSIENGHVEKAHIMCLTNLRLFHFRHHLTTFDTYIIGTFCTALRMHIIIPLSCTILASIWIFLAAILLNLLHVKRAYHNFTQFCTYLASKFAARFVRNSSKYFSSIYISNSIRLNLRYAKRAYHYFTQFCTFLASFLAQYCLICSMHIIISYSFVHSYSFKIWGALSAQFINILFGHF